MQYMVWDVYIIVFILPSVNLLMYQGIQLRESLFNDFSKLKSELQPFHLTIAHAITDPMVKLYWNLYPKVNGASIS